MLSNEFASLDPTLAVCLLALFSQLVQSRPVERMVIAELNIPSHGLHQMAGGYVQTEILVELHLLASDGVDKRSDQFEKTPDHERHCKSS